MGEAERLALLESYAPDTLVDDAELQRIVDFAALLAGAPIALVSLVEEDRQRFLARTGLAATETPRSQSFCQFAMRLDRIMEVPDATADPRFADNPLVTGPLNIRFYAGVPLIGDQGEQLGALCIISPEPRPDGLSDFQRDGLAVLGQAVVRRMLDRRAHLAGQASEARFQALGDAMPQMGWSTTADGSVDYFNQRWEDFTGVPRAAHLGAGWIDALHEDDRQVAIDAWQAAVDQAVPYEVEYRLRRHDGEWRWTLARGLPVLGEDGAVERWFGTNTDIHEARTLLESRDLLTRELTHRIKNIFSLVSGLLHLEGRANPALKVPMGQVNSRIAALARAHDYVRPDRPADASHATLKAVLRELFGAYDLADGPRVRVSGEDLCIDEAAITPLSLLFHELATNAAKYGALSADGGVVELAIARDGGEVRFDWAEQGGPDARDGDLKASGFGGRLIASAVEGQMKGRIERRWDEGGLVLNVHVPEVRLIGLE